MENRFNKKELLKQGHTACPGCGGALAMRHALRVLGEDEKSLALVIPACCWTIIQGAHPYTCMPDIPVFHTIFASAASTAAGLKASYEWQGRDVVVVAWAGDGGTFDIGLQALSGAAERGDDIIYICYDNEAYMNTGIQRSSSTPLGAWTSTTPVARPELSRKKDMPAIAADSGAVYAATASLGSPELQEDFARKLRKAIAIKGFRYIQICAPCPEGWKYEASKTKVLSKLAVETGFYPLYEIKNGNYRINFPKEELSPVEDFLKQQGRFKHLSDEDITAMQKYVVEKMKKLNDLAGLS